MSHPETSQSEPWERLEAELAAGEESALDPANETIAIGGKATTTLQSPWLHLRCKVCGHTFRPGDAVEVGQGGRVVHATAELPCHGKGATSWINPEATEFFRGLDEAWPPPAGLAVYRLEVGHFLTAPPRAGFRRRTCAVCGHTFRPQDHVVLCPCFPQSPRCQVGIHRDPVHGLHCYDEWNPGAYRLHCPATSRSLDE
jgi:hypothetical protein